MMRTTTLFAAGSLHLDAVEHPLLWVALTVLGACVLVATYWGIFRRSERGLSWALMVLRGVGLVALLLALAKPTWTREEHHVDAGRVGVVIDNSLSMSLADPAGKTRYALAKEAVGRLVARLEEDRAGPRMEVELADINGAALKNKEVPDQPTVERTDLVRAIKETTARLRSRHLAALVVISDGMDNTGRQDFGEVADAPVPIFTIGYQADAEAGGLDLAVGQPRAPARALVHNAIRVDVPVTKVGGPATEATLTIKLGAEPYASKKIAFAAGDALPQTVGLTITPNNPGNFVFTASIEADVGERQLANNGRHFPLRVDKEPMRVLYVEGFLRYEYKFLKARLEDDPDVSLASVVRKANPDQVADRAGQDLLTPERLKDLDVVILGDMEANYLSNAEYQALTRWLDGKHHALLVLGGYRSFGQDGFRATPLAEVLPVVFADRPPFQSEDPFVLRLTEEGRHHPIFEVSKDREKNADAWGNSPPLAGCCLVARAKASAEVLAVNPNVEVEGKPAVVIAVQRAGAGGHVMVLTADTTWRWSRLPRVLGQADTLYARFWSQTVRFLAGRGLDDQRPLLAVSTDRPDYEAGKKVAIRVVRQPRPGTDLSAAEVTADVAPVGGKPVQVSLQANSAEPDVFTGVFYPHTGGRYEVAATLTSGGMPVANQRSEFLVHGSDLELADPGTNRAALQTIAAATGGVYFGIEDADKVAEKIPRKERRVASVQRTEWWNHPGLFLVFIVAVSAEWFIRRRNHLV